MLTELENQELQRLKELQIRHDRYFSQEEYRRFAELQKKKFQFAGSPFEAVSENETFEEFNYRMIRAFLNNKIGYDELVIAGYQFAKAEHSKG